LRCSVALFIRVDISERTIFESYPCKKEVILVKQTVATFDCDNSIPLMNSGYSSRKEFPAKLTLPNNFILDNPTQGLATGPLGSEGWLGRNGKRSCPFGHTPSGPKRPVATIYRPWSDNLCCTQQYLNHLSLEIDGKQNPEAAWSDWLWTLHPEIDSEDRLYNWIFSPKIVKPFGQIKQFL
jgi:hypothetical protein